MILMYDLVFDAFAFIFAVSLLVAVHEYGHYVMFCRANHVPSEFAIGFGKILFSKIDSKGTKWSLRCLPFGGFVSSEKDMGDFTPKNTFYIALGGPVASFILGVVIIVFSGMFLQSRFSTAYITSKFMLQGYNTSFYDIPDGAIIHTLPKSTLNALKSFFPRMPLDTKGSINQVSYTIDNNTVIYDVHDIIKSEDHIKNISNDMHIVYGDADWYMLLWRSIWLSCYAFIMNFYNIAFVIYDLVQGNINMNVAGPIGIASTTAHIVDHGINDYIFFLGLFSIAVAGFNLIPIAPLDGYWIFTACARYFGLRLHVRIAKLSYITSLVIFFVFIIYCFFLDIIRLF